MHLSRYLNSSTALTEDDDGVRALKQMAGKNSSLP
jgi:hypothetical protein